MNTTPTPTTTPDPATTWLNVIAVTFSDDRSAYRALTDLKELDSQGRVALREAVVVVRSEDGRLIEKDGANSMLPAGTAGGGLIGLLIGIIGGPFGMLIGGATGLYVGALADLEHIDDTESALSTISADIGPGTTALLAVVGEAHPDVVDAAMSELGGTVLRRSAADVEAEAAAAAEAERAARRKARAELMRGRREHDREAVHARIDEMKARLHRTAHAASGSPRSGM